MFKFWCLAVYILPFVFFGQTKYKPKLLFEYDFPRRHQIGIKLLANKPLSYTFKTGIQFPFLRLGDYSNIISVWQLSGPLASIGTELTLKNKYLKYSLEYEYAYLTGVYQYPNIFNSGRNYYVHYFNIKSTNHLALLGINAHLKGTANIAFFAKFGVGYRVTDKYTYFYGLRGGEKNELKNSYTEHFNETIYSVRIGFSYCFGHHKILKPLSNEIINEINIYLKRNDSLVFLLIKNYQISRNAYNNLSKLKNECKDFMKHHKTINDTAIVCSYFKVLKSELNFKLNQRTMKVDAYKITKTSKKGKVKIKRLHKDLYIFRDNPKYKNLYEKNKLN